jgi:hypothetical protein
MISFEEFEMKPVLIALEKLGLRQDLNLGFHNSVRNYYNKQEVRSMFHRVLFFIHKPASYTHTHTLSLFGTNTEELVVIS